MFTKILIANRGEIATRIARTCREMGIASVAVYSEADRASPHVQAADEAVCIGPAPATESYLHVESLLAAARRTGAQAVHPGYGFVSESAEFARAAADAGLCFIGPGPEAMAAVGNKIAARKTVATLGVPVLPALDTPADGPAALRAQVAALGYPVLIKAAAGGGGKGMRIVHDEAALPDAFAAARREAEAAFGDGALYVERFLERPRHVEVQILGDTHGTLVELGERDCSVQRRYQKIVEETPSPAVSESVRRDMAHSALRVAEAAGYVNAGTVEFILDDAGNYYFLEVNARLQVEHPITEWVTGIDLVREQIRIAAGRPLGFGQDDVRSNGHAVECRLYAEDAARGFLPAAGRVLLWHAPHGPGVRVDSGVEAQTDVPIYYDPMIAKLSTWGADRAQARRRMAQALRETAVLGLTTNLAFLIELMEHPAFVAGETHTGFLAEHFPDWRPAAPPLEAVAAASLHPGAMSGAAELRDGFDGTLGQPSPWQQIGGWRLGS